MATSIEEVSDEFLVERCKAELPQQVEAYNELVRRHRPLVLNTCAKMIGNHLDAEEVCQDAFLRVYHKIHQFEERSSFKTWLFRIVYNMCLSRRGRLANRRDREVRFADEVSAQMTADLEDGWTGELSESIQKALDRLDEPKRRIVALKFISGLSIEEIAQVLNLKLSATKMRLYRARDELKIAYQRVTGEDLAA